MGKWKKLLFIGDSNMQYGFSDEGRWISLIADHLQRKCDVINRGFSGYNTKHLRTMLPQLLEEFEPETTCGIIILLGSNDSAKEGSFQHVPLREYRENMEAMLDHMVAEWGLSGQRIVLITPPRIDNTKWGNVAAEKGWSPNHFDELVASYASECAEIAVRKRIPLLDLNGLMRERQGGFSDLLFDGLHFSELGSKFLADHLKPIIDSSIAENLVFNYPYWMDVDVNNLRQ